MKIESQDINIDPETKIAGDVEIIASDSVFIGPYAVINKGFKVRCRTLYIGRHCYIGQNVGIGGGGCDGPNAHVMIGDCSLIADGSFINCAERVTIGDHVAFGYETQVWTHGVWQPVVDGFTKMKQEPVLIGNEVWLPSRCQVMPGVNIGNNVVVGMGSLVNRSLPSGCLAGGVPAKVLKGDIYPKPISDDTLLEEFARIYPHYVFGAKDKGYHPECIIEDSCKIVFSNKGERVVFNVRTGQYSPTEISEYAEDFRDFLRRWGFGFYGGGFFRSITPGRFLKAKEKCCDNNSCACGSRTCS